jgi:hypothetical protein
MMPKSTSDNTATIMVAARVALGSEVNHGVRNNAVRPIAMAVNTPAMGVTAPASKFTTERAKPPVTGKPPDKAELILAAPSPASS